MTNTEAFHIGVFLRQVQSFSIIVKTISRRSLPVDWWVDAATDMDIKCNLQFGLTCDLICDFT